MDIVRDLPHFRAALVQHPNAILELNARTYARYLSGELPRAVIWLMRYPDLLRALAQDAQQCTASDVQGQGDQCLPQSP